MSTSDMTGFPKKGDLDLIGLDPFYRIQSQEPDGGVLGGNLRGYGAVDLQGGRSASSQVASGQYSVAIGYGNTSSGANTTSIGNSNISSGAGAVSIGESNVSSGTYSICIGSSNSAQNSYSAAIGSGNTASGSYSFVTGKDGSSFGILGRRVHSSGYFASIGDAQKSTILLRMQTSNNTATTATTDGGAGSTVNQLVLQDNQAIAFDGFLVAKQQSSTNTAMWTVQGLIYRGSGAASTTLVTSSVTAVSNTPAWTDPTLAADTTNGCLRLQVTGAAATNIRWTSTIDTSEVTY